MAILIRNLNYTVISINKECTNTFDIMTTVYRQVGETQVITKSDI